MIEWRRGGWSGSINRWVRREVEEQLSENPAARRSRYGRLYRALRMFFSIGTFAHFVALYFVLDIATVIGEFLLAHYSPDWIPPWSASGPAPAPDVKSMMLNVAGYLITAQVGVLGVITLALALVTLIAQRESASTDVKLYYHESLSFEIVASSVALLAVMCAQLLWPVQFLLHRLGLGTSLQAFKLGLLGAHSAWLLINLAGLAHFIATTFNFVQQSAREELRERYTANVVQPREMTARLRQQLYGLARQELLRADEADKDERSFAFGFDFGSPYDTEIQSTFKRPMGLYDVRMIWVRWVLRRWTARCNRAGASKASSARRRLGNQDPVLWFTPHIDHPLNGAVGWCRRRGGVPLTNSERWLLRCAFQFRRTDHEA
jgi:hypothetical protein